MPSYSIVGGVYERFSNDRFQLHIHSDYEIYMFLEGDTKYIVEENIYSLEPGDIIIIRKNTLHRAFHNSTTRYRRIVINIQPEFFEEELCTEYETQFLLSSEGLGNKIDADIAKKSGLYDAFMRLKKYTANFEKNDSPVIRAVLVEILHIISGMDSFSAGDMGDERIRNIISYINRHFTKKISLDDIEKKFFISKYHLCHIFPKATGLTVHQYITDKRLALANDMIKDGMNKQQAAELSGFNDYSTFYRAYLKKKKEEQFMNSQT